VSRLVGTIVVVAAVGCGGGAGDPIDAGGADGPGSADAGGGTATAWIEASFAGTPALTGAFTSRTTVETPALVRAASGCCAKYAFDVREEEAPDDPRVGFVDVTITDLASADAFGGGIQAAGAPGLVLFLSDVEIDPDWPSWVSYDTTNYDGIVLDGAAAIYGEDVTIRNWNADGAIDNKAPVSQFVRLRIEGHGNRGIRYWEPGPHYLVESAVSNTGDLGEGSLLWFSSCAGAEVRIYASTFNGATTIAPGDIRCDAGTVADLALVYLTTDPRATGEMHAMFTP
jgi:hypothetical protein